MTYDEMPPVMRELFKLLPPPGDEWPMADRVRWLQAFEATARMVFSDDIALSIKAAPTPHPDGAGQPPS
jgi:hypothetical protein